MLYTEKYCDDYFASFTSLSPTYVWGCNICNAKDFSDPRAFFDTLYNTFHNEKYNKAYYDMKYQQAMAGSGWVSDCSGFFFQLNSEKDRTAQGFYNDCVAVGDISTIDRSHSCCIFKSKGTETSIHHIAWYSASDGYVYEMANSEKNFQRTLFNPKGWNYWGKPAFVDYSSVFAETKPYLYKGIDISTYQKGVNYQSLKIAGVEFVVLKIINKKLVKDDMFETHCAGCQNAGIKVFAVYNYSYALNADEARRDANAVIKALEGRKIPVCLDLENQTQTIIGHTIVDIINAYQEVVEHAGLPFILYTGLSFYNTYIKKYEGELHVKNLWIARYNKGYAPMQFTEDPDQRYKPMNNILAWQYTSSGQVLGITGDVDLDIIYKELDTSLSVAPSQPTQKPVLCPQIKNTVKTKGGKLNVRNKPNTSGKVIGQFNNGQDILVVGVDKDSGWYRLAVTQDMWCSNEWVASSCKGVVTAEKTLYIRSSDSTKGEVWGVYKHGDIVTILHQSGNTGWYLTPKGWISNKYVEFYG